MRNLVIFGVMALVLGFGLSAFAADNGTPEFYAVSQFATGDSMQIMTDSQLTTVEGMSFKRHNDCGCRGGKSSWSSTKIDQSNSLSQTNFNLSGGKRSGDVYQNNFALQSNKAIVR